MKLVAIIDDDASVRRATSSLVRSFGFSAVTFESAEAFLGSPQRADVSCVVCDVHMPGMSGVDLLDEMALEGRNTPMIFITAYTEERVRRRAGPSACILHKPFEAVDLAASLDDAVRPHG
ncbi:response regulator transcription factor [Rhodoplanes roseus]|nr:response regulator [Rhodoplanes roseus]